MKEVVQYFNDNGWNIVKKIHREGKDAEVFCPDGLNLCAHSLELLNSEYPKGVYKHQYKSIELFQQGNHVCLSTPTASGKTLVFEICALEILNQNPDQKILAVFPMRALTANQKERWEKDAGIAGYPEGTVAQIDGSVRSMERRLELIQNAKIIIMTPDVIHAWLLRKSNEPQVQQFLKNLKLLVIDEVHSYSGAFGSNAAYMFRRLKNIVSYLNGKFQIISASATLNNTESHLSNLMGESFAIVGEDVDSSKKHSQTIWMVNPPEGVGVLSHFAPLIEHIADSSVGKFIAFIDSRQDTERATAFSNSPNIKSFRAGYEEEDRKDILRQLSDGDLMGVVSTSALEVGINIPDVELGILWGVPSSMTSYAQRVGRVGRTGPGNIIIINNRSPHSAYIFEEPSRLDNMPLSESSLYLSNGRIQYIHALCLAMQDVGEIDKFRSSQNMSTEGDIELFCGFPEGFADICTSEREGQIFDEELINIRAEAGNHPHITFPLRHIETQYEMRFIGTEDRLEFISESQVIREAYPGAIFMHRGIAYRVVKIEQGNKIIKIRRDKRGITKPALRPVFLSPNLTEGGVTVQRYGDFWVVDAKVYVQNTVEGYQEHGTFYKYPQRNYYRDNSLSFSKMTSGVFIHVADFNGMSLDSLSKIANLLFDVFVSVVPYDRQDVDCAVGKFRASRDRIRANDKFIAIFDQNRGSLRLSARMREVDVARKCADMAYDIASQDAENYSDILDVLEKFKQGAYQESEVENIPEESNIASVVRIGSVVLNSGGKRIIVKKFFYDRKHRSWVYQGHEENVEDGVSYTIPVDRAIFDEDTEMEYYDFENNKRLDDPTNN